MQVYVLLRKVHLCIYDLVDILYQMYIIFVTSVNNFCFFIATLLLIKVLFKNKALYNNNVFML